MGRSPAPSLNGHDVSSALVNGSDKQRMSPIENGEDKKKDSPMTFGYGEISNKRAESPKMNGDLIITNGSTISKERKDALLSKYLNGNGDETQMESVPQTNGHNGYHNENETSIRTLSKLNGDSSGYTSGNSSIDTPNGLDSGPSSSSLLTPSWSSTLTSCSSLSRSPSTSSTIRPEDFDHAASRTRSDRLRQRLASLDRQNGVNGENGITNGSSSILERVSPSRLGTPSSSSILGESDDLTDLRKRLIGLQRDSSFTSSSTINEKFQSALLASRRSSQGPESGQLQPSSSRSRLFDHNRKSRSPPLGPIVEVESADGQKVKNCEICTDPLVNCGCGGKGKRRTSQEIIGFGKHEIRSTTQANGLEPQSQVGTMPFVVLHKVLRKLPYQELARLRAVHPHWDEICGQMLNSGYYQLIEKSDKLLMRLQRLVQKDSGMYYPTSVLTNIQVHILNQVDAMRAALDEGVGCFPYGILLDKTFQLVKQVEEMTNGGKQIDVPWEPVAILAKRASMHYKDNLESIMEERLGESARLKAAQKLIRLDSFLVETSVQKMEKENAKNRDDVMWEVEQLQQCNEKLRKDNRELKQNQMKLEARIDILEQKFKTMARLFS
ncbi:unnamed protein product, partial [Mesorhabditis belari]|uniref:F-box domain-containing protein n=1 Tax=Mesorhabditis belari TaxID=2138241 RepID=A0AAF3EFX1_9BILA